MPEMRILEPTASAHVQALRDTRQAERSGSRQPRRLGDLLPPSPPAEKATARCDQAGQSSTGDRRGNAHGAKQPVHLAVDAIGEEEGGGAPVAAPGAKAEGPKAAWRVADANINRDRAQECPVERVEGVNLAGDKAEIADQQVAAGRRLTASISLVCG